MSARFRLARRRRGGMSIETLALIPALALLLVGGVEFGKIAFTYYQLQKALRGAARMVGVLRGANFCDSTDPQIDAIKNFIVYGPDADTANPIVQGLTPDAITVTPERLDSDTGSLGACDCSGSNGCLASDGGRAPDYVQLSIDGGYPFRVQIPFVTQETIQLLPHVRVPFGGQ